LKRKVPTAVTATETVDVGVDPGSPVSRADYDRRPVASNGKIEKVAVELKINGDQTEIHLPQDVTGETSIKGKERSSWEMKLPLVIQGLLA
jgi:hypothetical protein